jgi:hypothetical protein
MIVIFFISARQPKHLKVCTHLYRSNSNNLVLLMHELPKSALIINCYDLWHFQRPFVNGRLSRKASLQLFNETYLCYKIDNKH